MAKKIMLVVSLGLALTLLPKMSLAVPTKGTGKKSSSLTNKKSSKSSESRQVSSSSKKRTARSSSKRKYRSYRRAVEDDYADSAINSEPYRAGIGETKPLIKVIPQRDGRFLLEPLTPKPKVGQISRPSSSMKNKNLKWKNH